MNLGAVLAVVALILEVIHWAVTHDSSLSFYGLALTTLAVILSGIAFPVLHR